MSKKQKIADGGPAFPVSDLSAYGVGPGYPAHGMSLRDWFAGQALSGYIANLGERGISASRYLDECASESYALADAMLAERAKARGEQP